MFQGGIYRILVGSSSLGNHDFIFEMQNWRNRRACGEYLLLIRGAMKWRCILLKSGSVLHVTRGYFLAMCFSVFLSRGNYVTPTFYLEHLSKNKHKSNCATLSLFHHQWCCWVRLAFRSNKYIIQFSTATNF